MLLLVDTVPDMIRTRLSVTALTLAVALTGCGGDSDPEPAAAATSASPAPTSASPSASPTPSPTPAAPKPPVDGGKYSSPMRLIEALSLGRIDCVDYSAVASPSGAVARGSCYVLGEEYTIGIYKSEAQAREQPKSMAVLLEGVTDVNLVLGQNWTVGCPDEAARRSVARVLGGEVFHKPM